jgi:hypothetical protein
MKSVTNKNDLIRHLSKNSTINKKGKIKKETLDQYLRKINQIHIQLYDRQLDYNNFDFLQDTDRIINHIINKYGLETSSSLSYMIAITAILNRLEGWEKEHKIYYDKMIQLYQLHTKKQGENKLTDTEKKNYLPYEEILKFKPTDVQSKAIYALYVYLPPRRNEYKDFKIKFGNNVEINKLDKKFNWYLYNLNKLVFNTYKTDKIYGQQIIDLNDKDTSYAQYSKVKLALKNMTTESLGGWSYNDNDILFPTNKGTIHKNWSVVVKNVFTIGNKQLSVNLLRHSFISNFLKTARSSNVMEKVANIMAHSIDMQSRYRKIDDMKVFFD